MKPFDQPIPVTQPFLPPLESVQTLLAEAWENRWLTNRGPILQRFEQRLRELLDVEHLALFANGTLAMEVTLRAMDLPTGGRVITTPFTFVGTANAIVNAGLAPVFVDVRREDGTLDPNAVEAAIDDRTVAIAPVHVYGLPCQFDAMQQLADRYGLKLLYDAAHCFGMTVSGRSIGHFGHASMFSLHATKLFHAVECGLVISLDPDLIERVNRLKNFGFTSPITAEPGGTNAKLSELHAAVGLACCEHFDAILQRRREQGMHYRAWLADVPGLSFFSLPGPEVAYNHSYMPILVDPEVFGCDRDTLQKRLNGYNVQARRYFYPLLCDTAAFTDASVAGELTFASTIADRILCLPTYHNLSLDTINQICDLISSRSRQPQ